MSGYHSVIFDYEPTQYCTTHGTGYTWDDGKFWFANCDPRGIPEAKYAYNDISYFYFDGEFTGIGQGRGKICFVRSESDVMDCREPVGSFVIRRISY